MRKKIKIAIIALMSIAIIISLIPQSYGKQAESTDGSGASTTTGTSGSGSGSKLDSFSSIWGLGKSFIQKGQSEKTVDEGTVYNDLKPLAEIVMGIAVLVLLSVGAILGVKYMFQGADERAKIKEKLIWYIVAAVLVFGAAAIFNIVIGILNNISD